jgi:hypothetical protein
MNHKQELSAVPSFVRHGTYDNGPSKDFARTK